VTSLTPFAIGLANPVAEEQRAPFHGTLMLNKSCSMDHRCSAGGPSEQDLLDRVKPSEIMLTSSRLNRSMICEQSKSGQADVHVYMCVTSISDWHLQPKKKMHIFPLQGRHNYGIFSKCASANSLSRSSKPQSEGSSPSYNVQSTQSRVSCSSKTLATLRTKADFRWFQRKS
jgi:hypothetical protein